MGSKIFGGQHICRSKTFVGQNGGPNILWHKLLWRVKIFGWVKFLGINNFMVLKNFVNQKLSGSEILGVHNF